MPRELAAGSPGRVSGFDVIRGFSVVSMVGFHLCYDLVYIEGLSLPWFRPPFQDIWRASISWVFLLVAGIMCSHSRDNLKRAGRYLAVAAAIFVVTTLAAVDDAISFGIIYCMGISTLVAEGLGRARLLPSSKTDTLVGAAAFLCLFLLCLGVPQGKFGLSALGGPSLSLPSWLYATRWLDWLGLPGPGFVSGDYYPPLPYTLLFLAGTCLGRRFAITQTPSWLYDLSCRPLEWIGQHALPIYILHQPILLAISMLLVTH